LGLGGMRILCVSLEGCVERGAGADWQRVILLVRNRARGVCCKDEDCGCLLDTRDCYDNEDVLKYAYTSVS
jgi:hypothetical protein